MAITEKVASSNAEIALIDRFTFSDSSDYRKRLYGLLDTHIRSLSITLDNLKFMDSAGLGMLMVTLKECQQRNIPLTLMHPRGDVKQMLELTKSYERFSIID